MNIFLGYVILFIGIIIGILIAWIFKTKEIKKLEELISYQKEILDKRSPIKNKEPK